MSDMPDMVPDERLKLPWYAEPYGHTSKIQFPNGRFTIRPISVDVHVLFDGSGCRDKYPDGVIRGEEEVQLLTAFMITACNNFHEMVTAMLEAQDALKAAHKVLAQCRQDDEVAEAHLKSLDAEQMIHVSLEKVKDIKIDNVLEKTT